MNRILLFYVLLFTAVCDAAAQKPGAVAKHGALHIAEGRMVDKNNLPPQLRGISLSWSIWEGQKYYRPEVVSWLATDFNISLLRVSMAIEPEKGYLQQPLEQERLVMKVIDAAIQQGLYVLIDWHDHHADANVERSKHFFEKMAKRYAGVPNVIYEIWNEPERVEWSLIRKYAESVIPVIRKHDPDNIIVVGSSSWDQDIDITAKDPLNAYKNIAYSFHFYASEPSHQELLMQRADKAIEAGLPVFVTEWGVGEANGDGVFDLEKTNKWLRWMEKHQLSWANWNVTDKKETTALLKPGASTTGGWPLKMLTPAGVYIREQLRLLNK